MTQRQKLEDLIIHLKDIAHFGSKEDPLPPEALARMAEAALRAIDR